MDRVVSIKTFLDEVAGPGFRIVFDPDQVRHRPAQIDMMDEREIMEANFAADIADRAVQLSQTCERLNPLDKLLCQLKFRHNYAAASPITGLQ